jgi:hypothetical protein
MTKQLTDRIYTLLHRDQPALQCHPDPLRTSKDNPFGGYVLECTIPHLNLPKAFRFGCYEDRSQPQCVTQFDTFALHETFTAIFPRASASAKWLEYHPSRHALYGLVRPLI